MAERLTVLVDMDGPLAGFDNEVLARMAVRLGHIPLLETRNNFYISDDYPEHAQLVRALSDEQGFFESLPVEEGALEGWEQLLDLGYHPRICSSPISTNPYSAAEKLRWLERHFVPKFGKYVVDEAIITKQKHLFDGIALIDDRPEIVQADEASWQHVIYDKEYNRHVDGMRTVTWRDPTLPDTLEAAKELYVPRAA